MKLVSKTIALLTAIVLIVLLSAGSLLLHYHEESLKKSLFEGLDGQARLAAFGIETVIGEAVRVTEAIATAFPVEHLEQEDIGQIEAYLEQMIGIYPIFGNGLFVLGLDGYLLADFPAHPRLRGELFADREYYQRTIKEGRGVIGEPYRSRRTGQPVLTFTALLRDGQNRPSAILACSFDLLSKQSMGGYRMQQFGTTGYLYVFDKSRLLVLHPDDKRLLTHVEPGKNLLLEAALSGFTGSGETVNSLGVPMLLAIAPIPVTDWMVAVQVPRSEAYAPVVRTRFLFFLIAGGAVLLVVSVGVVAIRRVVLPLRQLEAMAVKIGAELAGAEEKGTFAADYILEGLERYREIDEIGLLASAFSRLVITLDQTFGSLRRAADDWQRTFDSVNDGVVILDSDGRILRMNRAAEDSFRTTVGKVRGEYGYRVIFGTAVPPADWPDISSLEELRRVRWLERLEKPCGIFEFTIYSMTGPQGKAGGVLVFSDVTARGESDEKIRKMAFFDQLTGLPNRFLLQDRFQQATAAADRNGRRVGVMFIDLDKFKAINDNFGHDAGDEVLRRVSGRISDCLRGNDTLSRIGGDEFVVILCDIENRSEVAAVAERITETQAAPMEIGHQVVEAGSSIGIAYYPDDGEELETLLKKADTAMYTAKAGGRNKYTH